MSKRFRTFIICLLITVYMMGMFSGMPVSARADQTSGTVDYPVFEDAYVRKSKGTSNFNYERITEAHGAQYADKGYTVINAKYFGTDEIIAAMKFKLPTKAEMEEKKLNSFDFVFNIFKNADYSVGDQSYIFHYSTNTNWSETTLTWNNKPSFMDRNDNQILFQFDIEKNNEYEIKPDAEKTITTNISDTIIKLVNEGYEEITIFATAKNNLNTSILIHSKETSDETKKARIVGSNRLVSDIDPSDPDNIAYHKPARSNLSKDLARNVTDGNTNTSWTGNFYPSYVDIDLMDQYDLSEITLYIPSGKTTYYTIYGSNDGKNYDRLHQKRTKTAATKDGDRVVLEEPCSYRILRIYMEYTQGENKAYLSEVKVHGTKTDTNTNPLRTGTLEEVLGIEAYKDSDYINEITDEETYENIYGIVERTVGKKYVEWFSFELAPNTENDNDYFELSDKDGKVHVKGNKGISITTGLNYYYKNYLNVHISEQTMQVNMPDSIVQIEDRVRQETKYKIRYAFNYCTLSYTFAFFGEENWQRENDWLALNGVNVVLDLAGQEATWIKFLMNFGYSFDDAKDWLTGPAYSPWQFMDNMESFGGPVPDEYVVDRVELARSTQRWKNSLGMQTILQGYAGMVPTNFNKFQPEVDIIQQGGWNGFDRPAMIATDSALYGEYAKLFYEAQEFVYGKTSDYYAVDPFHEGGIRPAGLSDRTIADKVLSSMMEYDKDAVWIVQGWQSNPTNELLDGMGERREDHVLIVDLIKYPISGSTKYNKTSYGNTKLDKVEFNGTSWVWGLLANFGGNPSMHGQMEAMVNDIQNAKKTSTHMAGLGVISEAQYDNPILYDLIFDLAWADDDFNLDQWISKYIKRRYGGISENAKQAWEIMMNSNYDYGVRYTTQIFGMKSTTPQSYGKQTISYGVDNLETAFRLLVTDYDRFKNSKSYLYDLTEIMRQLVSNYAVLAYNDLLSAKESNDLAAFKEEKEKFMKAFDVLNAVQETQQDQLAGEWIGKAQDLAAAYDDFSRDTFELNAKSLISTWGSRQSYGSLKEYAWRNYEGMFIDLYKNIWEEYVNKIEANLETGAAIKTISLTEYFDVYWEWILSEQNYTRDAKDSAEEMKDVIELVLNNCMLSEELDPNIGNKALGRLVSSDTKDVLGKLSAATDGKKETKVTIKASHDIRNPKLVVDLVGEFQLSKIQVLVDSCTFDGYEVYISSDKNTWTKVGERVANDISSTVDEFLVSDTDGRYVKIKGVSADTENEVDKELAVKEIRAFGEQLLPTLEQLSSLVSYAEKINLDTSEKGDIDSFKIALQSAVNAIANSAAVDEVNSVYWTLYNAIIKLELSGLKNMALHSPVTAHNDPSGYSERLADDKKETYWDSGRLSTTGQPYETAITPGWAIIELGRVCNIEEIRVIFSSNNQMYWHNYELYSSLDGTTWTKIAEKTTQTRPNEAEDYHSLEHVNASYIKIVTTNIQEENGKRAGYQIAELQVIGSEAAIDTDQLASLEGDETVAPGQEFTLNYGLNGLSRKLEQGVYAQDINIHYDANRFEFVAAESLKGNGLAVLQTDRSQPGHVRIIAASLGTGNEIKQDGNVLKMIWRVKSNVQEGDSKIALSSVILADGFGLEVEAGGSEHSIRVVAKEADKSALNEQLRDAQEIYDTAKEGSNIGEYPAGSKAALLAAINNAKAVADNAASTQAQVNQAVLDLQSALQSFLASVNTRIPGDLNGDGKISIGDLAIMAKGYDKLSSDPDWDLYKLADLNGDSVIDIADLAIAARTILEI